ncbi:AMP-binding protein [Metallosphaera cuprina]|uniref:AMP-binding protein n=1 Tax=Metallosphaera cuprina TaxID=1006005 RepID=UPI00064F0C59|nr:AMP-binding protein [Metallosphaera cuprina]
MESPNYPGVDKTKSWYTVLTPLVFLERMRKYFKDKTALVYKEKRLSYQDFYKDVMIQANSLLKLGLQREGKVSIISSNRPEFLELYYSVPYANGVLVPINPKLSPKEIAYIINHSESEVVIVEESFLANLAEIRKEIKAKLVLIENNENPIANESAKKDVTTFKEFLGLGSFSEIPIPVKEEYSLIGIYYTSGTTGLPKGVMLHHRGAFLNAVMEALEHQLDLNSVYLWTLNMFHAAAWGFAWATVAVGATNVYLDKVEPKTVYDVIRNERVSHMSGPPALFIDLVNYMKENDLKFNRKIHMIVAGSPPAPVTLRTVQELGGYMCHVYGLTETYGPHSICEWKEEWNSLPIGEQAKLKSRQGVPYVGFEMDVLDPHDEPVPRDGRTIGEVVMRGNNVALGYYKDPKRTEESFRGGWFHSGDAAVVHPDGYVEVIDRFKDLIFTPEGRVSSVLVEKTLMEIPGVKRVAVYGIPEEKGEKVVARIETQEGVKLTPSEVIDFCKSILAEFECPKVVEFDRIPMTSTGKVQKYLLRKQATESKKL